MMQMIQTALIKLRRQLWKGAMQCDMESLCTDMMVCACVCVRVFMRYQANFEGWSTDLKREFLETLAIWWVGGGVQLVSLA